MTAYAVAIAAIVFAAIVTVLLVGALRMAVHRREPAPDALTSERLENLEQFVH